MAHPHALDSTFHLRPQWLLSAGLVVAVGAVMAVLIFLVPTGSDATDSATHAEPALVQPIAGSEVSRVILTEQAAARVDVQTAPTAAHAGAAATIPYSAVIYDAEGQAWAYTNPEPLTYVREPLEITAIEGDLAVLSEGPDVGMPVVTVGAIELFGAEFGVGH